ncbi:MAG: preprotein translocase subunit Sec61beta [Candidatus Thermoplasmatota archaeon]|jgi:preprotein translocase subunit Sec61beta|nr:preprotein translocase subunit Sec61beta [Candidatus Thermoplasmatota archaeon]
MAKEKKTQGFQSAAGLIRYFDAEDSNAIQISRGGVMLACLLAIIVVEMAEALGRETSAYVLLVGVVILILNEIRNSRSGSV